MSSVPTSAPTASPVKNKKDKLSGGAIAGIVIGVVVFVALLAGIIYYFVTKNQSESLNMHASSGFDDVNPAKLEAPSKVEATQPQLVEQPQQQLEADTSKQQPQPPSLAVVEERSASVVVF